MGPLGRHLQGGDRVPHTEGVFSKRRGSLLQNRRYIVLKDSHTCITTASSKDGACVFAFENFQADGSKESWLKHKQLYYDNFPGYESRAPSSDVVDIYHSA